MNRRLVAVVRQIAIATLMLTVVLSVVPRVREHRTIAAKEAQRQDLKQLMVAMHSYHDDYEIFPPAFVVGPDGERWHSWRALLLPYVAPEIGAKYRFDEPWNGPNNSQLLRAVPSVYQSNVVETDSVPASYFAVLGKRTLWPAHQSLKRLLSRRGHIVFPSVHRRTEAGRN